MGEQGFGYIADMLVFSVLISTAAVMLTGMAPVDPKVDSARYASTFAHSVLYLLQNTSAEQFGGFEYKLDTSEFEPDLPVVGDSAKRELRYKTITQLLAEDALLNLHVDIKGAKFQVGRPNEGMDEKLRIFLKSTLDRIIGDRFGYRLRARMEVADLRFARVHFESEVADLTRARTQLCTETLMLSLPVSRGELAWHIEELTGISPNEAGFEIDPILEVTLELWSR